MRALFDSNVVLYAAGSDTPKADRCDSLLQGGGFVSVQVLNETAAVAQRKMKFDWPRILDLLSTVTRLVKVTDLTYHTHVHGLALAAR